MYKKLVIFFERSLVERSNDFFNYDFSQLFVNYLGPRDQLFFSAEKKLKQFTETFY